jgi:hypothetical protein
MFTLWLKQVVALYNMDAFYLQAMALKDVTLSDEDQVAQLWQLIAMLLPMSPVRKADLHVLLQILPFRPEYVSLLSGKIDALKDGGSALWQDWSSIHKYITNTMVRSMADENINLDMVVWQLLNTVWKFGLRKPNQATFQCLTAIILVLKNGVSWDPVEKKKTL